MLAPVNKCCPWGSILEGLNCTAASPSFEWAPEEVGLKERSALAVKFLQCEGGFYSIPDDPDDHFLLLANHSLGSQRGELLSPSEYCIDFSGGDNRTIAYACYVPPEESDVVKLYPVGMFVSVPFLLLTFLVYAAIPKLRSVHGRCLMSHVASLCMSYIVLGIVQLFSDALGTIACVGLGYAIQFFFLATFFWLNIMCFDIYWAFSDIRKLEGSQTERERKKFIIFSTYAWMMPMLILILTVTIDMSPSISETSFFKPNIGLTSCFFSTRGGTWLYFYGPVAFLLLSNLFMFAVTAFRLYRYSKETSVLCTQESRRHDKNDRERFHLYLKLFIVMGINWVAEIISYIAEGFKSPQGLWYLTDITNTLQGLFIFIIFVWKKRVRRLIKSKLCPASVVPDINSKSKLHNSSRTSSSATQTTTISQIPLK